MNHVEAIRVLQSALASGRLSRSELEAEQRAALSGLPGHANQFGALNAAEIRLATSLQGGRHGR